MTPFAEGSSQSAPFRFPPSHNSDAWSAHSLNRGEVLYRLGDRGGVVYRVEEGLLKLVIDTVAGKERILALAGPGDLIGALANDTGRLGESAEAISEEVLVSAIPRRQLPPEAGDELLQAVSQRVESLYETITDSERPVVVRLAKTLTRLGQRFGQRAEDGTLRLTVPLTHEQLAAMIGSARETTSSALGELRSAGAVEGTRGRYRLVPGRLEEVVEKAA